MAATIENLTGIYASDETRLYDYSTPYHWLRSHFLRQKLVLTLHLVTTTLSSVTEVFLPILIGAAFETILVPHTIKYSFLMICLGILLLVVIQFLLDLSSNYTSTILATRIEYDVRDEVYSSLLQKDQTFYNRYRVGDIMARITNDAIQLGSMLEDGFSVIYISFLSLIVPIIAIGTIRFDLLLAPALFLVGLLLTLFLYVRNLIPISEDMRYQFGVMNSGVAEAITGIETIKLSVQEERERARFLDNAQRCQTLYVDHGKVQALYLPPLVWLSALAIAFAHGLILVEKGSISIGDLVAFLSLMLMLRYSSYMSLLSFASVQTGIASTKRILTLILEQAQLVEVKNGHEAEIKGSVTFENVSFGYDGQSILKHISFHVEPGQTVAIVGPSGCGKSTLLKLINRVFDPDDGRILIDDVDVRVWNIERLRSQIAVIEQDIFLFSRSISENITFGSSGQTEQEHLEAVARAAQAHDFILNFKHGYDTILGERGATLSGGQRQRLAIARALFTRPHILIMDNFTSAIDLTTEDKIQQAVFQSSMARTVFLVTNRPNQIRHADTVLVMKNGEIIAQGTHTELLNSCQAYGNIFNHITTQLVYR